MAVLIPKVDPLSDWHNLPLSHARIGYNNLLTSANGTTVPRAIRPNTYERWVDSSGTMTGVFQLGQNSTINYVAIAAHNLFSAGVTQVEISYSTTVGGGKTLIVSHVPISDGPMMIEFDNVENVAEIQVFIPNDGSTNREIGVVYCGQIMQMYQPIYGGHGPIDLNTKTEYQANVSETGQFLSNRIIKQGGESSFSWRHLDPDWVRQIFKPFMQSARTIPFFIKWRPDFYPDEVAYCLPTSDIRPRNMGGGHTLMSVDISVRSHSDL